MHIDQDDDDGKFDWENDPSVILHDQAAVAAAFSKSGELVVRQRDTLGCHEATLYIAPETTKKLRVVEGGDK